MKNIIKIVLLASGIFIFGQSNAQTSHKDSTLGHKISKTAKKVGDKTAQLGAKTYAIASDKKYKGKEGPHGETIFINKHSRYYYVDKKGHRVYLKKYQLRDKPIR